MLITLANSPTRRMWSGMRRLDSAYLSPSANIAIWSDQEHVHIEWDNRDQEIRWKAGLVGGSWLLPMPRDEFIEEMTDRFTSG